MKDHLRRVLSVINKRSSWYESRAQVDLSLISFRALSPVSEKAIKELQTWVQETYSVQIRVVGGRYGCSRIDVKVVVESPEDAAKFMRQFIGDQNFRERAYAASFTVLVSRDPRAFIDLAPRILVENANFWGPIVKGDSKMSVNNRDQSTRIGGSVTGSNVASHSQRSTQTTNLNPVLANILTKMMQEVETNDKIGKKEYLKAVEEINELKAEFSKPKPRRSVIERILGNLGSIASLASLVNQMVPFLPAL